MRDRPLNEIMVKNVITVKAGDPFHVVEERMRHHSIRHMPVVDKDGKLIGMITQRDLFHTVAPRKTEDGDVYSSEDLDQFILEKVMHINLITLKPENTLADAVQHMVDGKYGCIPIVDDERNLKGIITSFDVLKLLSQNLF